MPGRCASGVDVAVASRELSIEAESRASETWCRARDEVRPGVHGSKQWISYRAASGHRPLYLLLREEDTVVGVGVAFTQRPRLRPWIRPRARLDRLPWCLDSSGADPDRVAAALVNLARARRWAELQIHSFDGPSPPPDLAALDCPVQERFEFLVDLRVSDEERSAAAKSSHRRKVRQAERAGVTVEEETDSASLSLLRTLQEHTQQRRGERGEEMGLPDAAQFERLRRELVAPGAGRLLVGRIEGEPVSAVLLGVNEGQAYYLMGGTNERGLASNAATLVMWTACRTLHGEGFHTLNLGGVPARAAEPNSVEHGLYRFKAGFGGTMIPCRSGTLLPVDR